MSGYPKLAELSNLMVRRISIIRIEATQNNFLNKNDMLSTIRVVMSKIRREERFLKRAAVSAVCLILVVTNLLTGCACFRPTVKRELGTSPGKEGQIVEVHEEMPWPCKVFWGIMWVLSDRSTPEERRAKEEREYSKWLDTFNRQYREVGKRKERR